MKTVLLLALVFLSASSCGVGTGFRIQHQGTGGAIPTLFPSAAVAERGGAGECTASPAVDHLSGTS